MKMKKPLQPIDNLRCKIDAIDTQIASLLQQRAQHVNEIGKYKSHTNITIYNPIREFFQLNKLLDGNVGLLSNKNVLGIFRQIISLSYNLEGGMKLGFIETPTTQNSTLMEIGCRKQFGLNAPHLYRYENYKKLFHTIVNQEVDYAVVAMSDASEWSPLLIKHKLHIHSSFVTEHLEALTEFMVISQKPLDDDNLNKTCVIISCKQPSTLANLERTLLEMRDKLPQEINILPLTKNNQKFLLTINNNSSDKNIVAFLNDLQNTFCVDYMVSYMAANIAY
ncbi:MAG: hypothetical protein COB50_02440 [Thiotrichales bacterium]|nr:MAG: hypothetical protein COB50_02440 [Thiotrichales bacterium]